MTIIGELPHLAGPFRRASRLFAYLCMVVFGVIVVIFPSPLVSNVIEITLYTFGGCLIGGGLACAFSQVTYRYWGEIIGMPLLISSFLFYSAESFVSADPKHLSRLGFGFACIGISLFLASRWQDVLFVKKLAEMLGDIEEDSDTPGE